MNSKKFLLFLLTPIFVIFLSNIISAHCPLCTAGAAIAAGGALWLGVSNIVVAMFIGAFALSMGWWFGRAIKKKYIPYQKTIIITLVFLLTVLPILPIMKYQIPFYLSLAGGYGSLLNKTYMIDLSLLSSFFGGAIVLAAPSLSKKIIETRKGKILPFQGVLLTLALLIIGGVILQLLI